jgi:hypothetical protein
MPRIPPAGRHALRYAALTGVVLVTGAVIWTLGPGADWILRHVDSVHGLKGKELADALDAVRGRALAVATGLAALVAVYYTARNADTARRTLQHSVDSARRTAELTEQGQVTERYTKAIEQLGSDKLNIRIGGIYALERIAADSARDHPTVMEVLGAFVREHTRRGGQRRLIGAWCGGRWAGSQSTKPRPPDADVQAALTVIGRRTTDHDTRLIDLAGVDLTLADLNNAELAGAELERADLAGAKLIGSNLDAVDLCRANLVGANLAIAILTSANLTGAYLSRAWAPGADLTDAGLIDADLTCADLTRANLTRADLTDANLTRADLTGADLTDANLAGSDLRKANLADAKLINVRSNADTKWPEGFSRSST